MKKAGEIIKSARIKEKLSLNDVSTETKIPEEYVRAIENNNFDQLPEGVYAQLYVKKFAEYVGLSGEKIAAVFRRDYQEEEKSAKFSLAQFNFFSKWQTYIGVGFLATIFIGYLTYQYLNFVRPPGVRITQLERGSQGWLVSGRTNPQATIKINQQLVNLDEEGRFNYTAGRDNNQIIIVVQSPAGRTREVIKNLE